MPADCHFCDRHGADPAASLEVKLFRRASRGLMSKRFALQVVHVPRCRTCARRHAIPAYTVLPIFVVMTIGLFASYFVNAEKVTLGRGLLTFVCAGLLSGVVAGLTYWCLEFFLDLLGVNTERRARTFPAVARHLEEGWKVGTPTKGD